MWDRPEELIGRSDVDKHIQEPPHKRGLEDSKKTSVDSHFLCEAQRQFSLKCKQINSTDYLSTPVLLLSLNCMLHWESGSFFLCVYRFQQGGARTDHKY